MFKLCFGTTEEFMKTGRPRGRIPFLVKLQAEGLNLKLKLHQEVSESFIKYAVSKRCLERRFCVGFYHFAVREVSTRFALESYYLEPSQTSKMDFFEKIANG